MSARGLTGTTVGCAAPRVAAPVLTAPRTGAKPINVGALTGAPRAEIARRARRTLTGFALDRSGSMYGTWGDPSDICGAAVESLLALQRRSGGGRALIVPWGTEAPAHLVTGPVSVRTDRKELQRALRTHSSLGGNDLAAALERLRERTRDLREDETFVSFVLTDGIETVTPQIHHAVAQLPPASVHMCLIDRAGGCSPEMEADWRTVAFGSFIRLNHMDVRTMTAELVAAYASALALTAPRI